MPLRKTKFESYITMLEKELFDTRRELNKIKYSRTNRLISAIKGRPVAKTSTDESKNVFNSDIKIDMCGSLTNSLPLFKYTNINIGLMIEKKSRLRDIFVQTSNANDFDNNITQKLLSYGSLQAIVIDTVDYKSRANGIHDIKTALKNGSKLIVLKETGQKIPEDIKRLYPIVFTYGTDVDSNIVPFSNIYNVTHRQCPRVIDSIKDVCNIKNRDDIKAIRHSKISVLSKEFISSIKYSDSCVVLDKIAANNPVIVEGEVPFWMPKYVKSFNSEEEYESILIKLAEPYAVDRYAIACGRSVVIKSNALTVSSEVLCNSNIVDERLDKDPKVSVIISAQRPDLLKDTLMYLENQTLKPYEIILMLHGVGNTKIKDIEKQTKSMSTPVYVECISDKVLFGDVLNKAVDKVRGDYITKVDDDDYYGKNHILDLYAAHLSSKADFVGKTNNWTYLKDSDELLNYRPKDSHRYVRRLPGATMFAKTSVFRENKFGKVKRAIDSELYRRAELRGAVLYSTHKYNFVRVRHGNHTYVGDDDLFKDNSEDNVITGIEESVWSV